MKAVFSIFGLLIVFQTALFSQFCGTTPAMQAELAARKMHKNGAEFDGSIPVHFVLVANADGSGRATETAALEALCRLNEQLPDFHFYLYYNPLNGERFSYLDSDAHMDGSADLSAFEGYKNPSAMTVFVANDLLYNAQGYYAPTQDFIAIRKSMLTQKNVLSHEFGHAFGLLHTNNGLETAFSGGVPTWYPNAPFMHDGIELELMDGSNCATTSDLICDTSPDFGNWMAVEDCMYLDTIRDGNGTLIEPMIDNIMTPHSGCTEWVLTAGQSSRMEADLGTSRRSFLEFGGPWTAVSVTIPSDYAGVPAVGATNVNTDLTLSWTQAFAANGYVVEWDFAASFPNPKSITTIQPEVQVSLEENRHYFWRVTPFREDQTCFAGSSEVPVWDFYTSSATSLVDFEGIESITGKIDGAWINLQIEATEYVDLQVQLMGTNGQAITEFQSISINPGASAIQLPLNIDLPTANYMLLIFDKKNGRQGAILL